MKTIMKYQFEYVQQKEDYSERQFLSSPLKEWFHDEDLMNGYCYITRGSEFTFDFEVTRMYLYDTKGLFKKKLVLRGPERPIDTSVMDRHRSEGIEIRELSKVPETKDYLFFEKRLYPDGTLHINESVKYRYYVTEKYSKTLYEKAYNLVHSHKDVVIQMLRLLDIDPFAKGWNIIFVNGSDLDYRADFYNKYRENWRSKIVSFKDVGMQNLPVGLEFKVALAELISELFVQLWPQLDPSNFSSGLACIHRSSSESSGTSYYVELHLPSIIPPPSPKEETPNLKPW